MSRSIGEGLEHARSLGVAESGLAVVVTMREDGSAQASVVNAGVLPHPVDGEAVVAFVVRGQRRKLINLRARPRTTVLFRSGWDWVAVEGDAELAGLDDALSGLDRAGARMVLRAVYAAAVGGDPEDWAGIDEQMVREHHTAVLVRPLRIYSNPPD